MSFCYECQAFNDKEVMQSYDYRICTRKNVGHMAVIKNIVINMEKENDVSIVVYLTNAVMII